MWLCGCGVQNLPADPTERVTLIADTDVLVAAESSSLSALFFMRPWSAFVEVAPFKIKRVDYATTIPSGRMNHFIVMSHPPNDGQGAVFPNAEVEKECEQYNYVDIIGTKCEQYVVNRGVTPNVTQLKQQVQLASQFVSTSTSDDAVTQRRRRRQLLEEEIGMFD